MTPSPGPKWPRCSSTSCNHRFSAPRRLTTAGSFFPPLRRLWGKSPLDRAGKSRYDDRYRRELSPGASEYLWYAGAPMALHKGSRVRIPHKAVAVLAEGSPDVTGASAPGRRGPRWTPKSEYLPAYDAHKNLSEPERVPPSRPIGGGCRCTLFGLCSFFAAWRPPRWKGVRHE